MKYLLLDTNIYLHYKDFEQIDWATIVNDNDFAIVVPYIVIREIDKHKDGKKGKIKNRARVVSSKFGNYFLDDEYKGKVKLIQIDDPSNGILESHNLHRDICDDVIVGAALEYEHKDDIIVIAHDKTLLIKAKNAGLKFLPQMPEEYLIAEEKSEEEKEYERCRKELEQLKNRQPKPQITFANGETILRLKMPESVDVDSELEYKMTQIRNAHPHLHKPDVQIDDENPLDTLCRMATWPQYALYSEEQLEKHNEELNKYYTYAERYYRFKIEAQKLANELEELQFIVKNDGNTETGTMNIALRLPDDVMFYNENSVRRMNDIEPEAPTIIGDKFREFGRGLGLNLISPYGGLDIPQMKCWDLTKPSTQLNFNISTDSLVHGVKRRLNIKHSLYVNTKQCGNFAIDWCICAAGCVKPISGTLNVIIER